MKLSDKPHQLYDVQFKHHKSPPDDPKNQFLDRYLFEAKILITFLAILSIWFPLLLLSFRSTSASPPECPAETARFFIYELPPRFNDLLLHRCSELSLYTNMCPHVANRGLGRPIKSLLPVGEARREGSWYATHQFIAEMIFHARAEVHPCRTREPTEAELFYVPFYAGLYASSVFGESSFVERDRLGEELAAYLFHGEYWGRRAGADHFLAVGRTSWDFIRTENAPQDFGANRFFLLPEVKNMTVLTVERPLGSAGDNMFGIPYPSYFHPRTREELESWQVKVLQSKRPYLFAFVGGPRKNIEKAAVRAEILHQCEATSSCRNSKCEPGSSLCHEPGKVMEVILSSVFCLQPPGDSFTRRSVFDSILAGCIPVFFSEHTAYTQYTWYLPSENREEYSVMVPKEKWGNIEAELKRVPKERVEAMRLRVVSLIPSLTYMHPNASDLASLHDAVDVALRGLTARARAREKVPTAKD